MGKIRDRIGGMGRFKDGSTLYIFVTNYRCNYMLVLFFKYKYSVKTFMYTIIAV